MSENIGEFKSQLDKPGEEEEEEEEKETEGFVEVDGVKYKEDPENPGEALLDTEEQPIPFEEKKEEKEDKQFTMPDKFKGKSAEEIAKSYSELEKLIDKKAEEKAEEIHKKKRKGGKEEDEEEEEEEEKETLPMKDGKIDFSKMTPEQFANYMLGEIDKKAEEKAKKIYEESSTVREAVRTEISEAQKGHPLLKTNQEYRDLVMAIIESAAGKGKTIKLDEACTKVDALIGGGKKEPGEEEEKKLKQARAQVETAGGGAPGGGTQTEEEKIKEGLLGGQKTGELGGLGL